MDTHVIRPKLPSRCLKCADFRWRAFWKHPREVLWRWLMRNSPEWECDGLVGHATRWICARCGHAEYIR